MEIKWGLFGASKISNKFCRAKKQGEIVTVASKNLEHAAKFAKKHKIANYVTYDQMLSDESINAVYVSGSNEVHFEHCLMALGLGKNVLVEKPAVVSAKEWQELCEFAKQKNLLLMEAIWSLFLPTTAEFVRQAERLGKINKIETSFCRKFSNKSHRVFKLEKSGGVLYDLGIYNIHFCNLLAKSPCTELEAAAKLNEEKVDIFVNASLQYGEISAKIVTSSIYKDKNILTVTGEKGSVAMPRFWSGGKIYININGKKKKIKVTQKYNGFFYQIDHFEKLLLSGKTESPVASFAVTKAALEISDKILEKVGYGK